MGNKGPELTRANKVNMGLHRYGDKATTTEQPILYEVRAIHKNGRYQKT